MNTYAKKIVAVWAFVAVSMFVTSAVVSAQGIWRPTPSASPASQQNTTDIPRVLERVRDWLVGILLVAAGIFIVIAAFMYLTAGGNAETVKTANRMIMYTVVAVALALLAQVIVGIGKYFAGN